MFLAAPGPVAHSAHISGRNIDKRGGEHNFYTNRLWLLVLFRYGFRLFQIYISPLARFSNNEATSPFSDIEDYRDVFFRYKDYST